MGGPAGPSALWSGLALRNQSFEQLAIFGCQPGFLEQGAAGALDRGTQTSRPGVLDERDCRRAADGYRISERPRYGTIHVSGFDLDLGLLLGLTQNAGG